jgi:hypothetical protein
MDLSTLGMQLMDLAKVGPHRPLEYGYTNSSKPRKAGDVLTYAEYVDRLDDLATEIRRAVNVKMR